jgi:RNA:NAD 2'-phosphotransferase (TPT1/KptA family)
MKLTNDCCQIVIRGKTWTERYYRDEDGWVKISARRRKFRATGEQVLNHLLPALAGVKPNVAVRVEYRERGAGNSRAEMLKC